MDPEAQPQVAPMQAGTEPKAAAPVELNVDQIYLQQIQRMQMQGKVAYKTGKPEDMLSKDIISVEKGNIGRFWLTNQGFIRAPNIDKQFSIVRYTEQGQRMSIAVFTLKHKRLIGSKYETREVPFNDKLATATVMGTLEADFDAGTYLQIIRTKDVQVQDKIIDLEKEFSQQMEALNAMAIVKKDFLKKQGTWWEKYGMYTLIFATVFFYSIIMLVGMYYVSQNFVNAFGNAGKTFIQNFGSLLSKFGVPTG